MHDLTELLQDSHWRTAFLNQDLPQFLPRQRWFGERLTPDTALRIEHITVSGPYLWVLLAVSQPEKASVRYQIPLAFLPDNDLHQVTDTYRISNVTVGNTRGQLIDAAITPDFAKHLLGLMLNVRATGLLRGEISPTFPMTLGLVTSLGTGRVMGEQSNTAFFIGDAFFLKMYRRVEEGPSPEAEMIRELTLQGGFTGTPAWRAELRWNTKPGFSLALLTDQVHKSQEGWSFLLRHLQVAGAGAPTAAVRKPFAHRAAEVMSATTPFLTALAKRTAQMHRILATATSADFSPEPFENHDAITFIMALKTETSQRFSALQLRLSDLSPSNHALASRVLAGRDTLLSAFSALGGLLPQAHGARIRIHGDYHLGQVLWNGSDVTLLDFEGEPLRSLRDRRSKQPALRDVAGMLRSLNYVSVAARLLPLPPGGQSPDPLVLNHWLGQARTHFWNVYTRELVSGSQSVNAVFPQAKAAELWIKALEIHKAAYEIDYEIGHRPDWLPIPLSGLISLLT